MELWNDVGIDATNSSVNIRNNIANIVAVLPPIVRSKIKIKTSSPNFGIELVFMQRNSKMQLSVAEDELFSQIKREYLDDSKDQFRLQDFKCFGDNGKYILNNE